MRVQIGEYGKDADVDWDNDAAADVYQEWRNGWAALLDVPKDSPLVAEYLGRREEWYAAVEWYYAQRSAKDSPFFAAGAPLHHPSPLKNFRARASVAGTVDCMLRS